MKVSHLTWNLDQGGAETYICDLVEQLHKLNVQSEIILLGNKGRRVKIVEELGVPIKITGMRHGMDIAGILELNKNLLAINSDIIHSHTPNLACNFLLGKIKCPKIYTEHGGGLLAGDWKHKQIYKIFKNTYSKMLSISLEMANVMKAVNLDNEKKIKVIYNGTDIAKIDAFTPLENNELPPGLNLRDIKVGIIGRLVDQKGISTFIETAAILCKSRSDLVFPIVGDGELKQELASQAKNLGISNKILFLGFRHDAIRILKLFDIFLFTSNYEPFGLVLTEAMAAGVPIVALNLKGAVREVISDCENGIVVDEKNPNLLAEKVLQVLADNRFREVLIKNARNTVKQKFSIEQNAQKIKQLYEECLS